jgi:TRAP transporter 4TM/12TM fusion protein
MGYAYYKDRIRTALSGLFAIVFIYQAAFGYWEAHINRGFYILFSLLLTFLYYPSTKIQNRMTEILDLFLAGLSSFSVIYYMVRFPHYAMAAGMPLEPFDLLVGTITMALVLEACRRAIGWSLTLVGLAFLLYLFLGRSLPSIIQHRGFDLNRVVSVMYASTDGIFGSVAYVFSTFIFLFIIFGTFIQRSGAGAFFIDLAKAFVGRITGGAGLTSVVSSGILGSIIGSSTANTAITGAVTIPLMISRGYPPHVAASVEAVVSIGGQFLPPVMGAGAFLMAAFIGIPYIQVAKAGLIPALLFFASMLFMVYFEARRLRIEKIPRTDIPRIGAVLKKGWFFFVPIGLIIYLLVAGYSPSLAGFWAIVAVFAASLIRRDRKESLKGLGATLAESGKSSLVMAVTAGIVGIIIMAIAMPGLGMKFSAIVLELSGGKLLIALVLVMLASFVLGMGMNVTSAYLLLVTLAAPALVNIGIPLITGHFFIFWTSQLAVITPPVCLSAYVAAAIAKSDPWKTGVYSLKMGLSIYYIPFLFIFIPYLLWQGSAVNVIWSSASALIGVFSFSAACQGFLLVETTFLERMMLFGSALGLVTYGWMTDAIGFLLLVGVILHQGYGKNKSASAP